MPDDSRTLPGTAASARRPSVRVRWIAWAPAALAVQLAIVRWSDGLVGEDLVPVLVLAAQVAPLPFLLRNLSFAGVWLILIGLVLNLSVMLANGGLMPVQPSAVEAVGRHDVAELSAGEHIPATKNVLLEADDARLEPLSDTIVVTGFGRTSVVSVGDLVILPGLLLLIGQVAHSQLSRRDRWPEGLPA